ncbi:MAG: hypothetical protein KF782_15125 [Labilithrix sp.]|nr:hypothetical protein [Labilithrix sp.]
MRSPFSNPPDRPRQPPIDGGHPPPAYPSAPPAHPGEAPRYAGAASFHPGAPPAYPGLPSPSSGAPYGHPGVPPAYPGGPAAYLPAPSRISPWVWVLLGALLLGLGTCGGVVGLAVLGSQLEPGGVMIGGDIPAAKRDALVERGLCRQEDRLIAFYDGSLSLDMSEVALLTTDRVVFAKDAYVVAIPLASVASIDHRVEGVIGDVIVVRATNGAHLRIEVAHLNDGISFLDALEDEVRKSQPDVIVRRQTPR